MTGSTEKTVTGRAGLAQQWFYICVVALVLARSQRG